MPLLVNRRRLLAGTAALASTPGGVFMPYLSRAADRPVAPSGVQSGDVSADSGVVWGRADRPSRMRIEIATSDSFKDVINGVFVDALPETDFTAKALIENLPSDQNIFYRLTFLNHAEPNILSAPVVGRFRTAPSAKRFATRCATSNPRRVLPMPPGPTSVTRRTDGSSTRSTSWAI